MYQTQFLSSFLHYSSLHLLSLLFCLFNTSKNTSPLSFFCNNIVFKSTLLLLTFKMICKNISLTLNFGLSLRYISVLLNFKPHNQTFHLTYQSTLFKVTFNSSSTSNKKYLIYDLLHITFVSKADSRG